jgi:hypothetical protein
MPGYKPGVMASTKCHGPDADPLQALINVEATIRAAFMAVDERLLCRQANS